MNTVSPRCHYGWCVAAMGTLVVFGSLGLARFGYTALLPAMQAALAMDNTQAGMLATANLVGYLLLSAGGGALASRYGPRLVILIGLLVAAAGMLLTGLAHSVPQAALWRAVTGIGSGASNVPVMGLLAAWATSRRRGIVTGIGVSGSSLALIVIGLLVPQLLTAGGAEGWRLCWFGFGGITLLLALAAWLVLRNRPAEIGLMPLGSMPGNPQPLPQCHALEWRRVYRSPTVWHLGLVYAAFGFSYIIYMTFFVKRLVAGGLSAADAGRLFMAMGACSLLSGVLWGLASDRIGRRAALILISLTHTVAFALFAVHRSPMAFTVSAVLFGLSAWSIPAIMAAACGDLLGPALAPTALGFVTLFFGVGQALGPSVAGAIADAAHSFTPAFCIAAAVALLGALGAGLLHRPHA